MVAFRIHHQTHKANVNIEPHFFPKKLIMLPCPFFSAFFAFAVVEAWNFGFGGGATGSSSEKDSQAASSFVTWLPLALTGAWKRERGKEVDEEHTQIPLRILDGLLLHYPPLPPPPSTTNRNHGLRFLLLLHFL
jgi:hypothetical protein